MPIRLNLLAESLHAEELRRKDPVKRAILGACLMVTAVLLWSSVLQVRVMRARSQLSNVQTRWHNLEKTYLQVVADQKRVSELDQRLTALHSLATNRFLWGSAMQTLQHSLDDLEEVRFTRIRGEHIYGFQEEVKAQPNRPNTGKPPAATERIQLTLEARDASPQPGDQIGRLRNTLNWTQAGSKASNGVSLINVTAPLKDTSIAPRPFVNFTLQANLPERVRN